MTMNADHSFGYKTLSVHTVISKFSKFVSQSDTTTSLQEIMDVEHLWHYNELELNKLNNDAIIKKENSSGSVHNLSNHPLLAGTALAGTTDANPDFVANLCSIADRRLLKIVKWCKSLPLFKNISVSHR